ncbi:MAG: 30S ribosomal protein S12 methylthiotransferase RimO [Deltaproteobacteria bacterium]|nr:30S ribosomal protein S12 methylthiotransferase RimO [Deltaproteobacteria bacterium]
MSRRVHFVSLGCPKNQVDSEIMLGLLGKAHYEIVPEADDANIIVVNTCAFIEQSKQESVDTILEMAEHKKGQCDTLVVTGCLAQRYPEELAAELPEVDHFLGTGDYPRIVDVLHKREDGLGIAPRTLVGVPDFAGSSTLPRARTQPIFSQYLKVSEGCSNKCTFCIIPKLRGLQKSRPIDDLVKEAQALADQGCTELNLVGQDLTAYGFDLPGKPKLTALLEALSAIDGLRWIRLLYAYPRTFNQELIAYMATAPKILPYIDMPLQHIADDMLRSMRRGKAEAGTKLLLDKLKERLPELVIRTTFIVGYPGETDAHFETLYEFVKQYEFDRVGVFTFSQEDGTPAATLPNQVPAEVALERQSRLMKLQKQISKKKLRALRGKTIEVLVEGPSEETDLLLQGRSYGQAPEIDGCVLINDGTANPGDYVKVKITQTGEYDVVGKIVGVVQAARHSALATAPVKNPTVGGLRSSLPIVEG